MLRAIIAGILAMAFVLALGPVTITFLRRVKFGQTVRTDGPQTHLKKSGIPTMGGILIVAGAVLTSAALAPPEGRLLPLALGAVLGYFLVGLADDLLIIIRRRSLGLRARAKLFWQFLFGFALAYAVAVAPGLGTQLTIPGWKGALTLPVWLYVLFGGVYMTAWTNAVNLTDGLDGLAAGTVTLAAVAFGLIALGRAATDLAVLAFAVAGACLGFIWFNAPPAQVFMGDSGSLALGAALGALAMLTKAELLLVVVGGLFVLETLSVVIQVTSFKLTGRRVFKMSPLHHHFELLGWPESKVVARFWLIGLFFTLVGLLLAPGLLRL
ncbi:MAG: phospho-N-acetylmuramoyl-pentapeptide-transferase [Chitinophagales bacterium]